MIGNQYLAMTLTSIVASTLSLEAASFIPGWNGSPGTTSDLFGFTSADRSPSPRFSSNPRGEARMLVENETVFGAGWMDPAQEHHLTRSGGSGAWDLGQNGSISVVVPLSEDIDGLFRTVDVSFHLTWYLGPMGTPEPGLAGMVPVSGTSHHSSVEDDGPGSWWTTVWNATFENVTGDELRFVVQAPWNGAVVDSLGIYTRSTVVPEPSSLLLMGIGTTGLVFSRRRTHPDK